MIAVIQRVSAASVRVDGELVGKCGAGLCILLGVAKEDTMEDADALVRKILNLRIFEDEAGKMNRSLVDIGGEMLVISNFTLLAAYKKGNRPDYMNAAAPDEANELYEYFCSVIEQKTGKKTQRGIFGADMKVSLTNDGPFTVILEA